MLLPRVAIGDSWPVNSLGVGADIPPQYRLERMTNRAAPIKGCNPLDLGEPSPLQGGRGSVVSNLLPIFMGEDCPFIINAIQG